LFGLGLSKLIKKKEDNKQAILYLLSLLFGFLFMTVPQAVLWGITSDKKVKGSASSAFLISAIA
jgi:hypothetical protein